ncbi:MAG TPA: hypothetical protein VM537_25520 [Anaerolineae bacterium]|nr:hypothetical protein [Anaerolineae bacterium]
MSDPANPAAWLLLLGGTIPLFSRGLALPAHPPLRLMNRQAATQ